MASKMSKEHVAELLKQLEELKRKKAYKERKLQKLKNCSIEDIRKGHVSTKRTPDSSINIGTSLRGTSSNLSKFDKNSSQSNTPVEKCYSVGLKDSKADNSSIKLHENHDNKSFNSDYIIAVDQSVQNNSDGEMHKTKMLNNQEEQDNKIPNQASGNIAKCNSVQKDACKSCNLPMTLKRDLSKYNATHGVKEIFLSKKRKSSVCDDNFKFNDKNYPNAQTSKDVEKDICDDKTIKSPTCDTRIDNANLELNVNSKRVLVPELGFNSNLNISHDQKSSDNSKKPISNGKGHISDLLDDSLNANMSCFLSPDLFDNNNIDNKELNNNLNDDISTSSKISECPKNTENVSVIFNQKTSSPVHSHSPLNAIHKNTSDFSFPKFSTPTDLNFVISSKEENLQVFLAEKKVQKTHKFVENASDLNENVQILDEVQNHYISPQKFSPSKINCILGKGLSSVLDAQFESPKKLLPENENLISANSPVPSADLADETVLKKERLFHSDSFVASKAEQNVVEYDEIKPLDQKSNNSNTNNPSEQQIIDASEQQIIDADLDFCNGFPSNSGSFSDSLDMSALAKDSDEVPSQVTKTVEGLVDKVCDDCPEQKKVIFEQDVHFINMKKEDLNNDNQKPDSEILIVPETEGLGLYFSKDTEEFLETSTLSQNMEVFHENETLLNMSSQSKLTSPVVNNIIATVKLARTSGESHTFNEIEIHDDQKNYFDLFGKAPEKEKVPADNISAFENSLGLDTSFLEEDTQTLGNFKQVPYMNEINVQEKFGESSIKKESLSFICALYGEMKEPVLNVEIVIFGGVKYAFIQQARQIHIWRQEKNTRWIKIFSHRIEDLLLLVQICVTMDEDNLVIVMLLSDEEKYCLQFLLFEKDTKIIKLMENSHWLENSDFKGSILLCGLNGLMFATAQNKENSEVFLHAFVSLKENNPRLMTAVLGSTDKLCSLCKIDKLPNALMGISGSTLYVWHIMEARLVTAVTLHPLEYLPIKECFWATVENGLVYFLTTCEGEENDQVCQLLAANLATGFCQSAMTYSTRPSSYEMGKINKAVYMEPFLVLAHSNGAFMWSVTDEFCCAALYSKSNVTTTAIGKDFENWGVVAVGFKTGNIECYSVN